MKLHGVNEIKDIIYNDIYKVRDLHGHKIDHVIDIGGNIGVSALMFSILFPQAKVHTYEPDIEFYKYLEENINGFKNIKAYKEALGDGYTLYSKDRAIRIWLSKDEYQIHTKSLSAMVKDANIDIYNDEFILKCDCEGGEVNLLDYESKEIISKCVHMGIEIHFRSDRDTGGTADWDMDLKTWAMYDEWFRFNFRDTHHINYYKSNRHKGVGHYILRRKDKNDPFIEKGRVNEKRILHGCR